MAEPLDTSRPAAVPPAAEEATAESGRGIGRREVLVGAAGLALGGALGWTTRSASAPRPPSDAVGTAVVPWRGEHQAGIATPAQSALVLTAYDLLPGVDRVRLGRLARIWTDNLDRLTVGRPSITDTEPQLAEIPASTTVTIGFGPDMFAKAGMASDRPDWLTQLPPFGIDRLEDAWSGGDIVVQVCANDALSAEHTARLLAKDAADFLTPRWTQHGFRHSPGAVSEGQTMRNLFGQLDGTRNLDPAVDPDLVFRSGPDPAWLVGGTTMVVRRIYMDLDLWDEADRPVREVTIGRSLGSGAPLTGAAEHDEPDLDAVNVLGFPVIDTAAHIRRARTEDDTQRILRRVYNYVVPPAPGTITDTGLVFISFQADVDHQYTPLQQRLDEMDLLNTWTVPIGSAVFAVPRGTRPGEWFAQDLFG